MKNHEKIDGKIKTEAKASFAAEVDREGPL